MAMKIVPLSALLLVALLTTLLSQPGIANAQSPQSPPSVPGLLPPGTPNDVLKCWSSLAGISGCVLEIFQSVFSLQLGTIGADCCKAFLSIEESCWPKMFPLTPFFPPLLKNICELQGRGAAPPAFV
ncbi:putative Prolamin-like domain-containing protein [Rosa chinensis]|uniref:Putative Prolamin-like domain-containing protein n=1 Tax=Rosa chinensis TaxID=74649 RepID=A0A2P6RIK7_ROSCH|nr:egg cell-secreted protein 1.2 [Rosa chinensis]PRQ46259.1 putative Prolamin-like domain-containing protein [Rosa chinensis]